MFFCSLSQYSEDNMMDPYNLAICFGPTLMSVPEGHDQVSCQAHVNELIKTIIIHHESIFPGPRDLEGPVYERGGATEEYWWALILDLRDFQAVACALLNVLALFVNLKVNLT